MSIPRAYSAALLNVTVRPVGRGAFGCTPRRRPETPAGRGSYEDRAARRHGMLGLGIGTLSVDQRLSRCAGAAAGDAGWRGLGPGALGEKRDGDRRRGSALDQYFLAVAATKLSGAAATGAQASVAHFE